MLELVYGHGQDCANFIEMPLYCSFMKIPLEIVLVSLKMFLGIIQATFQYTGWLLLPIFYFKIRSFIIYRGTIKFII